MKRFLFICIAVFWGMGSSAQAVMKLDSTMHDFKTVSEHKGKVSCSFEFVNSGNAPLVISKTETFCTCTKADFPKKPVLPGEREKITVTYNPRKQDGTFHKAITIYANTLNKKEIVTIKGTVKK